MIIDSNGWAAKADKHVDHAKVQAGFLGLVLLAGLVVILTCT